MHSNLLLSNLRWRPVSHQECQFLIITQSWTHAVGHLSITRYCQLRSPNSRIAPRKKNTTMFENTISDVPGSSGSRAQEYNGLDGSTGPSDLLHRAIKHVAPRTYRKLERKMTMPTVTTLEASSVPWLKFSGLVVGRNSHFHTESLTVEQLEQIGGTEYRALRLLSYLVPAVCIVFSLFSIVRGDSWSPFSNWLVLCFVSDSCASAFLAMAVFRQYI